MLAFLLVVIGLESVDRLLLERALEAMKPPREPAALRALIAPPTIPVPPPPPPPLPAGPEDWVGY